jgi:NAD+ synthetase
MYIAVVQFNPTTGALQQNCRQILAIVDELAALPYPPDLVVFPAYALTGVDLGGLIYHNAFAAECLDIARAFMSLVKLPTLIGTLLPRPIKDGQVFLCEPEVLFCQNGQGGPLGFVDLHNQMEYEGYVDSVSLKINGHKITVLLDDYPDTSAEYQNSDAIIMMLARDYQDTNAMFTSSKMIENLRSDAQHYDAWMVVANLVGGEDATVFEGASIVVAPNGTVVESAPAFESARFTVNLSSAKSSEINKLVKPLLPYEADWKALTVAVRDYVQKNGFEDVVLGLSGGIDSAVTAALAVDALGAKHVHGILMPSPNSSAGSVTDAQQLAQKLGISTVLFPISQAYALFKSLFLNQNETEGSILAVQNLQARLRTIILMHYSNTYDWLLLNTGNKSEAAMGYSTLYGDTAGAFAPLGNIYKTDVYGLANWRNDQGVVIDQSILDKAPSAELYPGQLDSDNIPPYDVLDYILRLHIEDNAGVDEIVEYLANDSGTPEIDVKTIIDTLNQVRSSEFKRRQEPLAPQLGGLDVTGERHWPITNGFEDHYRELVAPSEIINYLKNIYRDSKLNGNDFLDN